MYSLTPLCFRWTVPLKKAWTGQMLISQPQKNLKEQWGHSEKCPRKVGDQLGAFPIVSTDVFLGWVKIKIYEKKLPAHWNNEICPAFFHLVFTNIRHFLSISSKQCWQPDWWYRPFKIGFLHKKCSLTYVWNSPSVGTQHKLGLAGGRHTREVLIRPSWPRWRVH